MPAGRPSKPTALKLLQGNPGKRAIRNKCQPKPEGGAPKCPAWLPRAAKAEWKRIVPILEPLGLLTLADLAPLASYCLAVSELQTATITLNKEGRTFKTETGYLAPHPAVAQQRSAWQAIKTYSALFGLDPSSRSRLEVAPQEQQGVASRQRNGEVQEDAFEEWLNAGAAGSTN